MEIFWRPAPNQRLQRRQVLAGAAGMLAICGPGTAGAAGAAGAALAALSPPEGPVLLTVEGGIAAAQGRVAFDRAMLEALPQESFVTSTIWTEGARRFSGPPLQTVLAAAGAAPGRAVTVAALNAYRIALGPEFIEPDAPVIATRIDSAAFGVRDKGPLWLVWPYDADDRFRSEEIFARSVWQLVVIVVES